MNGNEFAKLAAAMKTYFPRDNMLPTDEAMDLWYDALKDIPYTVASQAMKKYVMTSKFAPTIADIREQAASFQKENQEADEINEMAAWNIVWKAVGSSGDYERAEKNFNNLPKVIQRTVRTPKQLQVWALTQDMNVEVVSSNFMRTYRTEVAREKELRKLSPDILALISDAGILQESLRGTVIKNDESAIKSDESASSMGENIKLSNPMPEAARNKLQDKYKMRLGD